jgi:hypothetical protein
MVMFAITIYRFISVLFLWSKREKGKKITTINGIASVGIVVSKAEFF